MLRVTACAKALRPDALRVFMAPWEKTRPSWSRKLARPIVVKRGRPGELKTLTDARDLIHSLPERRRLQPAWQHVAELLHRAAVSRAPQDITHVTAQLYRTLASEGWL